MDVSKLKYMSQFFYGCSSLEYLSSFRNLDLSKVQSLDGMFRECTSLKRVDLSGMNFSSATSLASFFNGCTSLNYLKIDNLITSDKLTNINYMFYQCNSLKKLDLSRLNVTNVTKADRTFYNCKNLEELYLMTWHLDSLVDADGMFAECPKLHTIMADEGTEWYTTSEGTSDNMFRNSPNLINYDPTQITITKANNTRGGYFGVGRFYKNHIIYEKIDGQWTSVTPYVKDLNNN